VRNWPNPLFSIFDIRVLGTQNWTSQHHGIARLMKNCVWEGDTDRRAYLQLSNTYSLCWLRTRILQCFSHQLPPSAGMKDICPVVSPQYTNKWSLSCCSGSEMNLEIQTDPFPERDRHQNLTFQEVCPLSPPTKFGQHPSTRSWAILQTDRQTDRQTGMVWYSRV